MGYFSEQLELLQETLLTSKNLLGDWVIVLVFFKAIHYTKLSFQSSRKLSKIRIRKFGEETLI